MVGEEANLRGPCSGCGAQLATDQRYCVECGLRVGPPLALPYALPAAGTAAPTAGSGGLLSALPVPAQTVSTFAAIALGFGVVVGTAISPNLAGIVAAPSPTVVAQAPPPETPSTPATGGGGGGGTPVVAVAPAATVASTSPTTGSGGGGGGGGGGGKKKQKEEPVTFDGTVVRLNPVAQSYTIASNGGLIAIHAQTLPGVGDQLHVPVRKLKNGTYAEQGSRSRSGGTDSASFLGTVTYCADLEHRSTPCSSTPPGSDHFVYSVSSPGASVMVSSPSGTPLPAIGAQVQVGVHIGNPFTPIDPVPTTDFRTYGAPCSPSGSEQNGAPAPPPTTGSLTQTSLSVNGQQTSALIEGVVQQTGCSPDGLVLSSDDIREAGRDLVPLNVPAGIDQSKLTRGEAVQVDVGVGSDGKLTLKGITSDQGAAGADDVSQGQGTLVGS